MIPSGETLASAAVPTGDRAEIAVRTPDFARLDLAPEDTVFLIGYAPGRFKGVRRSDELEGTLDGAIAFGLDLLPDGPGEGYQIG